MTYVSTKFEVANSKGLGTMHLQEKWQDAHKDRWTDYGPTFGMTELTLCSMPQYKI